MKILALDTTGSSCSVAVLANEEIRAHRHERMARGHSEALLPMVRDTMAQSGLGFGALDLIAVTVGPGAFTGIRIGLAAARGIGLAARKPVLGLTTFEAFAEAAGWPPRLVVAIDSRREDVVFLQAMPDGVPAALAPAMVAGWAPPGELVVAGDAAERVAGLIGDRGAVREAALDAAHVARLAATRWQRQGELPPPRPLYLRAADTTPPKR